jgi:hypothetical protein
MVLHLPILIHRLRYITLTGLIRRFPSPRGRVLYEHKSDVASIPRAYAGPDGAHLCHCRSRSECIQHLVVTGLNSSPSRPTPRSEKMSRVDILIAHSRALALRHANTRMMRSPCATLSRFWYPCVAILAIAEGAGIEATALRDRRRRLRQPCGKTWRPYQDCNHHRIPEQMRTKTRPAMTIFCSISIAHRPRPMCL